MFYNGWVYVKYLTTKLIIILIKSFDIQIKELSLYNKSLQKYAYYVFSKIISTDQRRV